MDENHPVENKKFLLFLSGVKDMFLRITVNMTCTITVDEIPSPILYIFLPPLGKNNRDESELSVRKKFLSISRNKSFSFQSLKIPFIGFVIAPVMCILFFKPSAYHALGFWISFQCFLGFFAFFLSFYVFLLFVFLSVVPFVTLFQ